MKKKHKQVFVSVDYYIRWKSVFNKLKHKAFMEITSGRVYVYY